MPFFYLCTCRSGFRQQKKKQPYNKAVPNLKKNTVILYYTDMVVYISFIVNS